MQMIKMSLEAIKKSLRDSLKTLREEEQIYLQVNEDKTNYMRVNQKSKKQNVSRFQKLKDLNTSTSQ